MKRYTFYPDAFSDCYCVIEEDKNGGFVRREDAENLVALLRKADAMNDRGMRSFQLAHEIKEGLKNWEEGE